MRVLVALHPHQHSVLPVFWILTVLIDMQWYFTVFFIYHSFRWILRVHYVFWITIHYQVCLFSACGLSFKLVFKQFVLLWFGFFQISGSNWTKNSCLLLTQRFLRTHRGRATGRDWRGNESHLQRLSDAPLCFTLCLSLSHSLNHSLCVATTQISRWYLKLLTQRLLFYSSIYIYEKNSLTGRGFCCVPKEQHGSLCSPLWVDWFALNTFRHL